MKSSYVGVRYDKNIGWVATFKRNVRGGFRSEAQAVAARRLLVENPQLTTRELKDLVKDVDPAGRPKVVMLRDLQRLHGRKPYSPS